MKITATVTLEVKDGKPETRTSTTKLYSCDVLSDVKIDPKAVIVSVDQCTDKYDIDINEFVKLAHVEQ